MNWIYNLGSKTLFDGFWRLATGNWLLATGSWRLANINRIAVS
jgi:hypothetical protein